MWPFAKFEDMEKLAHGFLCLNFSKFFGKQLGGTSKHALCYLSENEVIICSTKLSCDKL